jgi:hypothetical protein
MEYSTEQSTVGKWRSRQLISISHDKWLSVVRQKQNELAKLGLELNVVSVNQSIKVKMEVPMQSNPKFGKNNCNLVGKAVKADGPHIIKKELMLDYPLDPSLLKAITAPSRDPNSLEVGVRYVLSEETEILSSPAGDTQSGVSSKTTKVPAKYSIQVLDVSRQKGKPLYHVNVFDLDKTGIGVAWVSFLSLVGQKLEIEE